MRTRLSVEIFVDWIDRSTDDTENFAERNSIRSAFLCALRTAILLVSIPLILESPAYIFGDQSLPALSASASRDQDGKTHVSLVNIHPDTPIELTIDLGEVEGKKVSGKLLSSPEINSHNTFEAPERVVPVEFKGAKIQQGKLELRLPAKSVVVLEID